MFLVRIFSNMPWAIPHRESKQHECRIEDAEPQWIEWNGKRIFEVVV